VLYGFSLRYITANRWFLSGSSAVVAENQRYWHELQQQQIASGTAPIRIIDKDHLQLFGVIGQGAFGIVLRGLTPALLV